MEKGEAVAEEVYHEVYFFWYLCEYPIGEAEADRYPKNY